jgi:hypothetical protein
VRSFSGVPASTLASVFLLCCVLTGAADEEPRSQTLRFATTVPALEGLREWLREQDVTHVAMESTGSYWPVMVVPTATIETFAVFGQFRSHWTTPAAKTRYL